MLRAVSISGGGVAGNFSTLTVTGQALFADGALAAPSISFINNPGAGFYLASPAQGRVDFVRAGSSLVIFPNSGGPFTSVGQFRIFSTNTLTWTDGSSVDDLFAQRDAVGLLGLRNSIALRGGAGFGMKALAGSYSVGQDDFTICCSTATTGFTILLPNPPAMNQYLNIKKVSSDANRLIIDGNGNLIDALSTQSTILTTRPNFSLQFGSTVASPTGSAWQIL